MSTVIVITGVIELDSKIYNVRITTKDNQPSYSMVNDLEFSEFVKTLTDKQKSQFFSKLDQINNKFNKKFVKILK